MIPPSPNKFQAMSLPFFSFFSFSLLHHHQTNTTPTPTLPLPPPCLYLYSFSFLFLLSLNYLFPIMITFCKKSVHSFLGLNTIPPSHHHDHNTHNNNNNNNDVDDDDPNNLIDSPLTATPSQTPGRLIGTLDTAADDHDDDEDTIRRRSTDVSESTSTNSFKASSSLGRGIGFIDDIGGGVNGLMSCTESLGFESSDERRVEEDDHVMDHVVDEELTLTSRPWSTSAKAKCSGRRSRVRRLNQPREVKKYPPPISSLNQNGQPSFYLRAVRKDGRLELTEVRIHRPEILRAFREDGRLRLQFVREDVGDDDEEGEEEEEEEEKEEKEECSIDLKEEEKEKEKEKEEVVSEELVTSEMKEEEEGKGGGDDDRDREMKVPVSGGEGLRRCHDEVVNNHNHHQYHQHQHHLHVWRQTHCVTIR